MNVLSCIFYYFDTKNFIDINVNVGAFFASRPRAKPVGALSIFARPTLERLPPWHFSLSHIGKITSLFLPYKG